MRLLPLPAFLLLLLLVALATRLSSGSDACPVDGQSCGAAAPLPVSSAELRPILLTQPVERLEKLGQVSDVKGSLQRTFLSPASLKAARMIDSWMQEAGLRTWTDGMGNVHGRVDGPNRTAPALLLGSHLDTVMDAGKYDGLLGILCAISALHAFLRFDGLHRLPRPVEIIAFSDEEGVRFQSTFLGSSAIAGVSPPGILHALDSKGTSVAGALEVLGLDGSPEGIAALQYEAQSVWGYVEAHIEQGPVLEDVGGPLGVVPAIAGQSRLRVVMLGEQGHAGTVPMRLRKDPMAAAAAAIVGVEELCRMGAAQNGTAASKEEADASGLVCTVGQVDVWPGASNVIPGQVMFTLDIRARADEFRQGIVAQTTEAIQDICEARGLKCTIELKHDAAAVECSSPLVDRLAAAAQSAVTELGARTGTAGSQAVPRIVSGAGHDAMAMAKLTQVAMLFVRCKGGMSHRPDEAVTDSDVLATSAALLLFLRSGLK